MRNTDRFDLYRGIHKGLRMLMGETLTAVGRADHLDVASVSLAMAQLRTLLEICRIHLDDENRFIHAAIEARRPGILLSTVEDHRHHEQEIGALEADACKVEAADGEDRARVLHRLYRALGVFVSENLEHMETEERDNNALLWELYSDDELAEIERELVASLPPGTAFKGLVLILQAATPAERVAVLGPILNSAPPSVFDAIMTELKSKLSQLDRHKLAIGLERKAAA